MMNLPLVSIALCTYNGEKYLSQQLDTLLQQSYKNIEIIAIDDCSSDGTCDILLAYSKKHPAFHVYKNETNKGFLKNFETALGYCKGEFISFCDQDDLWDPRKIELTVAAIGDNQFIYHDSEFIDENNESMNKKMSDIFNFYRGNRPEPFLLDNCVSGHAMLIRRDLLQHAHPFREGFYHDWWLAYVACNIGSIDFIDECLVRYRQHSQSNTDLLNLDGTEKAQSRAATKAQKIISDKKWLKQCVDYPENKNPEFVKTLYNLYTGRFNSFTAFRFYQFVKQNMDLLFYIKKQSRKKKEKSLKGLLWGFKLKNSWYKYVKPNQDKIVDINA